MNPISDRSLEYLESEFGIQIDYSLVEGLNDYLKRRDQGGVDAKTIVEDSDDEGSETKGIIEERIPDIDYYPGDGMFLAIMNSYAGRDRNRLIFAYEYLAALDLLGSEIENVTGNDLLMILSKSKFEEVEDYISNIDLYKNYDVIDLDDLINPEQGNETKMSEREFTRFEKARIIGARALQISYGAPVLVDYPEDLLDPIDIAMLEYDEGLIPITVVKN